MSTSNNAALLSPDNPAPSRHHDARPVSVSPASTSMMTPVTQPSRQQQKRATHTIGGPPQHSTSSSSHHHSHQHPSSSSRHNNGNNDDQQTAYHDVYSHPAAVAYAAAHPRRSIPKFGPYLLLQTLGEGEFGKVKLGLHSQWGEEVAVKLIRRGNVDSEVRMSKVEREIEVLRNLKHPNIVRLYDVIETDKYIGIILEYASGGELFDHILAHRYLKERDAAKLFSQLISGVWYIHQKKIVHRDLKLENLLLDKNRNVIITDFGFANRFEHKSDDLMQTSCGSPCYAAPELVISEGLYVGSAVDIWSCGVILYAMLAGYLPFDDDPANPDGDNINLLYKYIVNTPLSFPEYVSDQARDILSMMLVPDPKRRSDLISVMRHPWLAAHAGDMPEADKQGIPTAFGKTVADLEKAAMEQHQMKRLAYQKQMRAAAASAQQQQREQQTTQRSQSHRADMYATAPPVGRTRSDQPQYLYESPISAIDASSVSMSAAMSVPPVKKGHASVAVPGYSQMDIDPFAGPSTSKRSRGDRDASSSGITGADGEKRSKREDGDDVASSTLSPKKEKEKEDAKKATGGFRHTIQVEYDSPGQDTRARKENVLPTTGAATLAPAAASAIPPMPNSNGSTSRRDREQKPLPTSPPGSYHSPSKERKERRPSAQAAVRPQTPPASTSSSPKTPTRNNTAPSSSVVNTPTVSISAASPPATPTVPTSVSDDRESKHKKRGSSIGGIGKIFGSSSSVPSVPDAHAREDGIGATPSSRVASESSSRSYGGTASPAGSKSSLHPSTHTNGTEKDAPSTTDAEKDKKSGRRSTLTVMVGPILTIKNRTKSRMSTAPDATLPPSGPSSSSHAAQASNAQKVPPMSAALPTTTKQGLPAPAPAPTDEEMGVGRAMGNPASTSKARKVMQWFRTKNKATDTIMVEPIAPPAPAPPVTERERPAAEREREGKRTPPVVVTSPTSEAKAPPPVTPTGFISRIRNSVTVGTTSAHQQQQQQPPAEPKPLLPRIHHGPLDSTMVTTHLPSVTIPMVREILKGMGLEVQMETEFKFRCVRAKKRKVGLGSGDVAQGVAAYNIAGTAASNGVDKRGLPVPSAFHGGNMLRGLLMRRQSSQVSSGGASQPSLSLEDDIASPSSTSPTTPTGAAPSNSITAAADASTVITAEPGSSVIPEPLYGNSSQDAGDEVRFSVELTRLDRLKDTYTLDVRRLKGNLRSYQFLYDAVRTRTLQRTRKL